MRMFLLKSTIIIVAFILITGSGVCARSVKKIKVDSVSFNEVKAFSPRRLSKVMITRTSRIFSPYYYIEDIFLDDIKSLELFYHQNGYLEAEVTHYNVNIDSTQFKAQVEISIAEGERTFIEGFSILGNSVFPDSLLLHEITIKVGDPFLRKMIDDSTLNLVTFYADHGYLDAEVKPDIRIDLETHRVLIDFNFIEKSQFAIGEIRLEGLDKTRKNVVMRELVFNPDEVINYSLLLKSQRNIYLTGLFQSVFIRPQPSSVGDSEKKDILIEMKEAFAGEFNVSGGYGSVDRVRGKMEVYNNNVWGKSLKLGFVGKVSFIQSAIETSFSNPWTFAMPVHTDMNFFMEWKDEPGYNLNRIGEKMVFGRKFNNNNINMTFRNERTKLSQIKIINLPDDTKFNTRSIKLTFNSDTRDNLFKTTKGYFFEASNELGWFITEKNRKFIRFNGQFKYFYPFNALTTIGTAIEFGAMNTDGGLSYVPLHERFYAGGPNSIRGFEYEKLGPLDKNRIPIGGRVKIVWNLMEVRRRIYKMIGSVLFVDIGNVWFSSNDIRLKNIRSVIGLGLRVNTPIGLGRLDYGIKVDRQKDESLGQLYFSMGQAF
ncbi:outer membrane protein assembly factor BamA [Candidatus Latescibacterota bacterium]